MYNPIHNQDGPHQVHKSYCMYLWVRNLVLYTALCQGEKENLLTLTLMIKAQRLVVAYKVTQAADLN